MSRPVVHFSRFLGLQRYGAALKIQESCAAQARETGKATLLALEHPPVYTVGLKPPKFPVDEARLRGLGAEVVKTTRGGDVTFHGPGQLVVYPILDLRAFTPTLRVRDYVYKLEETLIETCAHFGVKTSRTEDVGVWAGSNKIAALGVAASQHITMHGIAINCSTDLKWFLNVVPCGLQGKGVTSLSKETHSNVLVSDVLPVFLDKFSEVFNCDIETEQASEE